MLITTSLLKAVRVLIIATLTLLALLGSFVATVYATTNPINRSAISAITGIDAFAARPPIHILAGSSVGPRGLTPTDVKTAYHLPYTGGTGTIAIISAYHHASIASDLSNFSAEFLLPNCSTKSKCLEIHSMGTSAKTDSGWDLETALDTEWSHAIAPLAKILVVEAKSTSGTDLMKAVDYAAKRSDAVSVSMSWGGGEFPGETKLDSHFSSNTSPNSTHRHLAFFASSGDDGAGASWPAISPNVIAVGGTSLTMSHIKNLLPSFVSEKAWTGSGGGVSAYENEPAYQVDYSIPRSNSKRAIPDVSYAADPDHGFSVYHSSSHSTNPKTIATSKNWYVIGGTSAGAPQWAAIQALGSGVTLSALYSDKSSVANSSYFRDIVSGKNGSCVYYCEARRRYDYVTGLGSPVTFMF